MQLDAVLWFLALSPLVVPAGRRDALCGIGGLHGRSDPLDPIDVAHVYRTVTPPSCFMNVRSLVIA